MGLNISVKDNAATGDITVEKTWNETAHKDLQAGISITSAPGAVTAAKLKDVKVGATVKATVTSTPPTNPGQPNTAALVDYDNTYVPEKLDFNLQVGADGTSSNKIGLKIEAMSSNALSLLDTDGRLLINGIDSANADKAIDAVATAIQKISTQRSALGSVQNRLEHAVDNLSTLLIQ